MNRRSALLIPALISTVGASALGAQGTVTLLGYHTTVPAGWNSRPPASTSRLAEYVIGGADSTTGAEVIVYFFGKGVGGTVAANVARWESQFSTPDGSPVPKFLTIDSTAAGNISFAELRGTYARGIGAGSSADQARTGQTLIAAIVETPRGTLTIQLFGPSARVAAERAAFMAFVRGLKE